MKKVYIAHRYENKEENKLNVEHIMMDLLKFNSRDYAYVSPIHNYGFLYNEMDYMEGIKVCLNLLSTCDILLLCGDDWNKSKGVGYEIDFARKNNIKIMTYNEFIKGEK